MGADFLITYVHWRKGTPLNFDAAEKLIEALTQKQVVDAFDQHFDDEAGTPFLIGFEPSDDNMQEEPIYDLDRVKLKLRSAIELVKHPWDSENTGQVSIGEYEQVIVAGMSWGDAIPEAELLQLLEAFKEIYSTLGLL